MLTYEVGFAPEVATIALNVPSQILERLKQILLLEATIGR